MQCSAIDAGACSNYLPQLASADPSKWGVSVCTVDGQRFSIGDTTDPFTMQSTSNILTYSICLTHLGKEVVHKYQGKEPSGRTFDEIALDHHSME